MNATRIHYMYRDASNWKFHGSVVISGCANRSEFERHLFDGEWFVPERVGLQHLLTEPWSEDDHLLHELGEFETCEQPNSDEKLISARELLRRFESPANVGWFSVAR